MGWDTGARGSDGLIHLPPLGRFPGRPLLGALPPGLAAAPLPRRACLRRKMWLLYLFPLLSEETEAQAGKPDFQSHTGSRHLCSASGTLACCRRGRSCSVPPATQHGSMRGRHPQAHTVRAGKALSSSPVVSPVGGNLPGEWLLDLSLNASSDRELTTM